tara:strand:- start:389 stop:1117 length:729 start_codon:yes stop_codon:yes gene_type:complete
MDRIEKTTLNSDEGFIKAVFPFDDAQKSTILNILQYSILAVIPIIILLKLIKNYVPEVDDDKGSLVIFVEVIGQIFVMFLALYFIHRIIDYIPTYSGIIYGDINLITMVLPTIFIILTMQTKVGEKVQLLIDRLMDLYDGQTNSNKNTKQQPNKGQPQGQVRVTQPISHIPSSISPPPQMQSQMTNMKSQTNEYSIPQTPDFNNMYAGPETPLVGASTPGMDMMQEPMAANDVLGGSFGSSF